MRPIHRERLFRSASHVALYVIVAYAAFLNEGCSKRGHKETATTVPSFEVLIDTKLKPTSHPLPRYPDGAPRPLATLTDKSRKQTDFVENELLVELATQNELNAFLAKTRGSVLAVDRPKTVGIKANPTYLIRVQTETADVSRLAVNLSGLNPKGGSAITVNSEAARRLIAIGAQAAMSGKHVGINYLTTEAGFQDGLLAEAPRMVRLRRRTTLHTIS